MRMIVYFSSFILAVLFQLSLTQNLAPRFEPSLQYNYFFPEYNSTRPGDVLFWLNATDYDDDDLQFGVEGDFHNKLVHVKKIDGKHAQVIGNQIFDRETQEKYENIFFYVKDKPGNKVYQSVRFVILDIDDNPPVFKNTPYKIDISENTPVNAIVFDLIEAVDADGPLYNKFQFSLNSDFFAIEKTTLVSSGHYRSELRLIRPLDYERAKSHIVDLMALAENSPYITSTQIIVNIIDYPDSRPEFAQSPYYVKIEEELPLGAFVLRVYARDGDSGINNPCKYKINDNNPAAEYFSLDSLTGDLTIAKRIDLESEDIIRLGGLLEFKITAIEIGDEESTSETLVTVAIFDLNDNKPKFDAFVYNLKISPKSLPGTSLTLMDDKRDSIHVFDLDKGINGSFSLFLLKVIQSNQTFTMYDDYADFEVVPKIALNDANLIIKLKDSANIVEHMGKIEQYHIFAKDNGIKGNITYANLMIKIDSMNQYAPQFEKELYVYYLDENSPFNTTIAYIAAYDNDTLDNYGQIYYELKNGQDRFQIDKDTGRIYTISTNPTQQLDRELIDTFYISVDAIDLGGLRTSVQIIVKLNDLNDNPPHFLNNMLSLNMLKNNTNANKISNILVGFIEENSAKWLEPIKLQAVDRDIGINSAVVYEIVGGDYLTDYFKIDNKTNTIVLKDSTKLLDFEEITEMHLMKKYLDLKSFMLKDYLQFDKIELNPGEIDVNLIVMAKDLGVPSLSSKIMAKIIVKDVNDHKPKFSKKSYTTQVTETAKSGAVFQVNAVDLDAPNTLNSKVNYRIESGGKDKFYIDSNTGWIRITENANLDRDLFGSSYTLKIVANDFGTLNENLTLHSSYRNNRSYAFLNDTDNSMNVCYVKIEIIDVNNKKPQFLMNSDFTAKIAEQSPIGTNVIQIKAEDPDANPNLKYFLVKSSSKDNNNNTITNEISQAFDENRNPVNVDLVKDWFDIEPKTGYIYTKSKLDREFVEQVNLVIGVEDLNASPEFKPQISTTVVKIKILDSNDNYPIFPNYKLINPDFLNSNDEPIYEAFESLEENTKINTKLLQLQAIDLDKKRNITYKLVHSTGKQNLLLLDSLTGEIFVNGEIDHEVMRWINLTIIAFDSGTPYQKHTLLLMHFKIEDLNDNEPTFVLPISSNEFYVYENSAPNTVVAKFTANDSDSGQFGTVYYRIISGDEGKFSIHPETGILYVKTSLDREEQDLYTLVIQARDNPTASLSQQLSNSLLIRIKIIDVNDNSPYCESERYSIETIQNAEINTSLLQIKALDKDIGKNAQIRFALRENNKSKELDFFKINSTNGLIQISRKLTGLSGLFTFTVELKDNENDLVSNSGNCTVHILVKDFNSYPPKFIFPDTNNPTIRIKQSTSPSSYLLTINATDPDTTGEIFYYLDAERKKNNDWKSFNIDAKSGVLTLNTKLDLNKQSTYTIDIIASDGGKPAPLTSRLTLTIIVVDDANNAAQFNRMQICLSGSRQCDSNFQSLVIRLSEEKINNLSAQSFRLAKINDITKSDDDICYYLSGRDSEYFDLDKSTAVLRQKYKLDRESRDKYELIIKATENCNCLNRESIECGFINKTYDANDQSQLMVTVYLDDINDNVPKFAKKFYQIGITSEIEFGETIFESFAVDLDSNSSLNFSLITDSLINSLGEPLTDDYFPFKLEYTPAKLVQNDELNEFKLASFQLKSQKHFREQDFNINKNRNNFYQFNITVTDQDNKTDTTTMQIILINKQQRVKLVFAQPLERVLSFQEEFRMYINNLTGYVANIDKISLHRGDDADDDAYETTTFKAYALTDMFLHFVKSDSNFLCDWSVGIAEAQIDNNIINADSILSVLDRSKDIELLRKFKLSLAEKYDDQGMSTFYKYGTSLVDDDFFTWTSTSKSYSSFITRLILSLLCLFLLFFSIVTLVICCCMRYKYKKKMKTEKALIKAFGLEQRSLSYNDAISGYINSAFDSNSLLPIPGTNLYSYEGSNPIWLRKYDKIETKTQPSTSSSGSSPSATSTEETKKTTTNATNSIKSKINIEDCSSFYLKQVDTTPGTSRCSSSSETNNPNEKSRIENLTLTSEILSIKDASPNHNEFKNSNMHTDTLLTFASATTSNKNEARRSVNSVLYLNNLNEDPYQKKFILLNQSSNNKDCSDLFEVESTVI